MSDLSDVHFFFTLLVVFYGLSENHNLKNEPTFHFDLKKLTTIQIPIFAG